MIPIYKQVLAIFTTVKVMQQSHSSIERIYLKVYKKQKSVL